MAKKWPDNQGDPWTKDQVQQLRQEVKENTPTRILALHLGRTEAAVRLKAGKLNLSLKPTNRRPRTPKK